MRTSREESMVDLFWRMGFVGSRADINRLRSGYAQHFEDRKIEICVSFLGLGDIVDMTP